VLQPDDIPEGSDSEKWTILTVQPRIAAASLGFVEIPAGMLDDGTFAGKAAEEIEEECGLKVEESELINMSELALADVESTMKGEDPANVMYPSPGGCDETIPIFLCEKRMPRSQIQELEGKLTGLRDEGEKITLKLVKLQDVWKYGGRDGKTLAAMALYSGLKAEGKI
jgi:ADP-sugar diphosphatase